MTVSPVREEENSLLDQHPCAAVHQRVFLRRWHGLKQRNAGKSSALPVTSDDESRKVVMIHRCALAIITKRGHSVIPPSIGALEQDEEDFLHRHVERLRSAVKATDARGRLRHGSTLAADMADALTASDDDFLIFAGRLVDELAKAMKSVGNAPDCVVAILTEGKDGPSTTSLLKLDAEIEAAQLKQTEQGIRLRVFKDLLPRPGDLQKGISWPDPRSPESEIIVLDHIKAGTAALYFQSAMRIDASPRACGWSARVGAARPRHGPSPRGPHPGHATGLP